MLIAADIGGTRARFAVVSPAGEPGPCVELACAEHAEADGLVAAGIAGLSARPSALSLAVAGPVRDGDARLMNRNLRFSETSLERRFDLPVRLWNDFHAAALGAVDIDPAMLLPLGGERPARPGPMAVIGPGTGLGTALVDPLTGVVWASEGGHADLASTSELEDAVLTVLRRRFGRVSQERVLSGPGLENLYKALADNDVRMVELRTAARIVAAARKGDVHCIQALELFVGWLGATVGNFALMTGASAVRLTGGLALRVAEEISRGEFRRRFENKGRLNEQMLSIPVDLVLDEHVGLRGAARAGHAALRTPCATATAIG